MWFSVVVVVVVVFRVERFRTIVERPFLPIFLLGEGTRPILLSRDIKYARNIFSYAECRSRVFSYTNAHYWHIHMNIVCILVYKSISMCIAYITIYVCAIRIIYTTFRQPIVRARISFYFSTGV